MKKLFYDEKILFLNYLLHKNSDSCWMIFVDVNFSSKDNKTKNPFQFSKASDHKVIKKSPKVVFLLNEISQVLIKIKNINVQIENQEK